jgi:hypothetical protein
VCGYKNNKEYARCISCSRDIYGFRDGETTPAATVRLLRSKIDMLEKLFSQDTELA